MSFKKQNIVSMVSELLLKSRALDDLVVREYRGNSDTAVDSDHIDIFWLKWNTILENTVH